jgi:uncharacterized protein (DUF608 family)
MRVSALKKIFEFNVKKFSDGRMGALNGMGADGQVFTDNEQIQEVWVGTTFGLSAEMMAEGLQQEAFSTAKGIYDVVYEEKGYWFRTPEAWGTTGMYRASMYMATKVAPARDRQQGRASSLCNPETKVRDPYRTVGARVTIWIPLPLCGIGIAEEGLCVEPKFPEELRFN